MKIARIAAACALAAAALTGCASARHGSSVKGLELPVEKAALRLAADVREGGYKVVSTDELKKRLDGGEKILLVDALPAGERAALGHIGDAVNAPFPKTEKELTPADGERLLAAVGPDKGRAVVLYCGFVACRRSHHGAKLLVEKGYTDVSRYPGGIVSWAEAGYPLSK